MAFLLRMPGVSADADTALLDHWAVSPGEKVSEGTVLGTVETDRVFAARVSANLAAQPAAKDINLAADELAHRIRAADGCAQDEHMAQRAGLGSG